MSRKIQPHTERSIYKPSNGFHGFLLVDDDHRKHNSFVPDTRLDANFTSAVQKSNGEPWLEIDLTETWEIKTGSRSKTITVTLRKEEMLALRDVIDAALKNESGRDELDDLIEASKLKVAAMSDEEREAMYRAQKESFVRAEKAFGSDKDEARHAELSRLAQYPEHLDPVERQIIDVVVRKAVLEGKHVEVYGDGELDVAGQGYPEITKMIAACSMTELVISDDGHFRLWVQFVHGNDCDVLSDHTTGDFYEEWLSEATALAERLSQ